MHNKRSFVDRDVYSVLGLPFDKVSLQGSINKVSTAIQFGLPCFISTPNLNFVVATQSETSFFDSVVESDLSVADGMPLIWVAKLLGIPITERVAGSSLFDELSKQPRENKIKVFFFGGQQGVAEQAHNRLNRTSVCMLSCGFYDPGFVSIDQMSAPAITDVINAAKPDFIVVALGAKKGQSWIQKNRKSLKAPVISHLGAVINFVAGNIERAPAIWQRMGLEWLWRIKQEPALWKRYLFDGLFFIKLLFLNVFPLAIYDRILKRTECFKTPCIIEKLDVDKFVVQLSGSIHHLSLNSVKILLSPILDVGKGDLYLQCSKISYIDGAFIATLMLLQNDLTKQGRKLILLKVPKRIQRILKLNNALSRFQIEI